MIHYLQLVQVIPFGDKIVGYFGLRTVIFLSVLFLGAGMTIVSLVTNYYAVLATFVILIGPSYGVLYVIPFLCSWRFFPLKSNEVNATLQAGYGLGAALFSYFAFEIVNPTNDHARRTEFENGESRSYFEECVSYNARTMFRFFAVAFAILGVFALLLLKDHDGKQGSLVYVLLEK